MENKVLIIDDDVELSQELAEILKLEGYIVETALNCKDGKALLEKGDFSILILDYRLPKQSGLDVLRFIKEKKTRLKTFVVTGKPFIEKLLKEEGLNDIVTSVINKPFRVENLLSQIKA